MYEPGNENLVIGDFGEKARRLLDEEKISEGHYMELLHKIGIDVQNRTSYLCGRNKMINFTLSTYEE